MRIKITVLLFCLICSSIFAVGVPSPSEPRLQVNADGKLISDDYPLPTKIIGTSTVTDGIASITNAIDTLNASNSSSFDSLDLQNDEILGSISTASTSLESKVESENAKLLTTIATSTANYASIITSSVSVTDTSADITAESGRDWLTLQNTGANIVYGNIGGTPATTAGYKIFPNGSVTILKIPDSVSVSVVCDSGETATLVVIQGVKP